MIAVGKLLNLSENIIAEAAIEFKGIKHRIEYVKTVNDIEFYNDSKATNTDSTVKALSSMVKPTVLILGGKDKGQCFDGLFEECKKKEVARIVLYGEARYKLLKCAEKLEVRGVCLATNLYSATALAYAEAQKGQSVLFSPACSSFDEFSCFEERGERFIEYVNSFS
jgi:UDP-N-acetylmuramoylalanine--D-glutamate ligase